MGWPFLQVVRDTWRGQDNWGTLFVIGLDGHWEKLSYTYELPWLEEGVGICTEGEKQNSRGYVRNASSFKRSQRLEA